MFGRWLIIYSLLIFLAVWAVTAAQKDVPPPLGYAVYSEDHLRYYVYDFEKQQTTTIPSAIPAESDESYGETLPGEPPPEIAVQSPYDESVKFVAVRVDLAEGADDMSREYDLYRIFPDGTRRFVAANARISYDTTQPWSPNGRYVYVEVSAKPFGISYIHQYDLVTNQLKPLEQKLWSVSNCQGNSPLCIVYEVHENDEHGMERDATLFLFDRDTSSLWEFGITSHLMVSAQWLGIGTDLLYFLATDNSHYTMFHYDAARRTGRELAQIEASAIHGVEWPESQEWLLIRVLFGSRNSGLYVYDWKVPDSVPLLIAERLAGLSFSSVPAQRWLDERTLVYSALTPREERVINVTTFPDGGTRTIAQFDRQVRFFDHDWSPDGRWLVLAASPTRNSPAVIYLISLTGDVRQLLYCFLFS